MKFQISLALVALVSLNESFGLFRSFKSLIGLEPSKLFRAKGDTKTLLTKRIEEWDASVLKPKTKVKSKRGSAKIKYYKPKKVEGKAWSRIYLKKGSKAYAGLYVQSKCSDDDKIESKTLKKAMEKSLDQKKVFTVECGNKLKEGKRH